MAALAAPLEPEQPPLLQLPAKAEPVGKVIASDAIKVSEKCFIRVMIKYSGLMKLLLAHVCA
jgi:hypothetical protein